MARRHVNTLQNDKGDTCKIYRDSVWCEYVVRYYLDGALIEECDYFTDDVNDAISTAHHMLNLAGE